MRALAEIAFRLLTSGKRYKLGLTGWISVTGIILGVACLSVSMAVMSGFVETLQKSLSDVTGDVQVFKLRTVVGPADEFNQKIAKMVPDLVAQGRFLSVEGVLAHQGRVHGAFLQGLEPAQIGKILNLSGRVKVGELKLEDGPIPKVLIGKGLAEVFGLKPGDKFRLLVPLPSEFDPHEFRRKVGQFEVAGVMELGKYEYDERMIIMPLTSLQKLADVGDKDSGLILKLKDSNRARKVSNDLNHDLGVGFRARDWRDINENIFEAVELERVIVFFVIMVIVVASAFNVATSLYVSVIQRYPEIGILKAMGVSSRKMVFVLCAQGFFMGLFGCGAGLTLGLALGYFFEWAEVHLGILPQSVYRIAHIELSFRLADTVTIVVVTLFICVIATLAPARRGARLSPVEGLRYE